MMLIQNIISAKHTIGSILKTETGKIKILDIHRTFDSKGNCIRLEYVIWKGQFKTTSTELGLSNCPVLHFYKNPDIHYIILDLDNNIILEFFKGGFKKEILTREAEYRGAGINAKWFNCTHPACPDWAKKEVERIEQGETFYHDDFTK